MDPTTLFCPNEHCPARGHTGQGNSGIHARKEQRCICHECDKTCSARKGTVFSRLRTAAATVVLVVTLLAHGCPVQAMVAALGCDERTIAAWWARSGRQGQAVHECLVERPRDLGQGQADELRVKKHGGIVWMALALMVQTRLWLGGAVREQRDRTLLRRLIERVRRCAAHRSALVLYRGAVHRHPSHARDLARSRAHGHGRAATVAPLAQRPDRSRGQVLRAAAGRRDRPPHYRWHAGTRGDAQRALAGPRRDQDGIQRTAACDLPGTSCAAGASVSGAGTPHPDPARRDVCGRHSLELVHAACECVPYATDDTGHGGGAHRPWRDDARTVVVSRAAVSLGTPEAVWTSFTSTATRDRALVFVTTVNCGATRMKLKSVYPTIKL